MNTKEQRIKKATDIQNSATNPAASVWVSANAGTGKTHVLIHRILRLLLTQEHLKPAEILALTFTKAAANEMRNRVTNTLLKWAKLDEKSLVKELEKLTNKPATPAILKRVQILFKQVLNEPVNVSTLHGFCQQILCQFPIEAGLPPQFTVLEDIESQALLKKSQNKAFEQLANKNHKYYDWFVYFASSLAESTLREKMHDFIKQHARIRKLLMQYKGLNGVRIFLAKQLNVAENFLPQNLSSRESFIPNKAVQKQIFDLVSVFKNGTDKEKEKAIFLQKFLTENKQKQIQNLCEYMALFLTKENKPRSVVLTKNALKMAPKYIESIVYEEQKRLQKEQQIYHQQTTFINTMAFLTLGSEVLAVYEKQKQYQASIDFDDLTYKTAALLNNPHYIAWVQYKLDSRIKHVLLDEGQDIDADQYNIVRAITDEFFSGKGTHDENRTLFAVGDVKQSIYRFRGAQPHVFSAIWNQYLMPHEKQYLVQKIEMETSFRSTETVLNFVDILFKEEARKKAIDENVPSIQHISSRVEEAGYVEIWPQIYAEKEEKQKEKSIGWQFPQYKINEDTPKRKLANRVAKSIKNLLESNLILSSKKRAVSAGDIIILLRGRSMLPELVAALNQQNLLYTGLNVENGKDHPAVSDLIALLKFLSNKSDDVSLVQVLKSALFNWGDDQLIHLQKNRKNGQSFWGTLYEQLANVPEKNILKELLKRVDFETPYDLLTVALQKTHARGAFLERYGQGNISAIQNINMPIDILLDAALNCTGDLTEFVNTLEKDGLPLPKNVETSDAIQLMTVHGSKGLQAPIVYVLDVVGKGFYGNLGKETLLWNNDKGKDSLLLYKSPQKEETDLQKSLIKKERQRIFNDEMRLLYVALTRAADRLYIGSCKGVNKVNPKETWYGHIESVIDEKMSAWQNIGDAHTFIKPSNTPVEKQQKPLYICDDAVPEWAYKPIKIEKISSRIASADIQEKSKNQNTFKRGDVLHNLFEVLPKYPQKNWLNIALQRVPNKWKADAESFVHEIKTTVKAYPWVFGRNSYAEIPIGARHIGSGYVDRLIIDDEYVTVLDFKTNKTIPPKIPVVYVRQLQTYFNFFKVLYPHKKIRIGIIWTAKAKLEWVDNPLMEI